MIKISRQGVGSVDTGDRAIHDSTGLLPLQVAVTGEATYRILGRVDPDAPWHELRSADTDDCLETLAWVPFLQLDVTAGDGSVALWVGG